MANWKLWNYWEAGQSKLNHAGSWVLLLIAIGIVGNIFFRYFWSPYTILVYELVLYLHIWVVLVSLGFALQEKANASIDILSTRFSIKTRAYIDLTLGVALTLPVGVVWTYLGFHYALASWRILERSLETGGLDYVYLSKTAIPVAGVLIVIQAVVGIVRAWQRLKQTANSPNSTSGSISSE